ncbi:MAG: selenide, water dikinase SelD [Saprospiraceae bacterium]
MQDQEEKIYKLTQYSHGAGCGCKIAPAVLDKILSSANASSVLHPSLLVGNKERDDAAVMDIGDGTAIVSTTDFFMPIVDDPKTFGKIAAVNAISDIYAMGASPLMAIAILGWPIKDLPPEVAGQVIEGGRAACAEAGIPLAGGHSIDCPEPVFGLAVTGKVDIKNLKKNGGATIGSSLFLTKPLGVGILATSQKKGLLTAEHQKLAIRSMTALNKIGEVYGKQPYIEAMTDVTGFGLMGHLSEMCEASNTTANVYYDKVPLLDKAILEYYLDNNCIPGGTNRNWDSYGHKVAPLSDRHKHILCDPQTSGGLLVAVAKGEENHFHQLNRALGIELKALGTMVAQEEYLVNVL